MTRLACWLLAGLLAATGSAAAQTSFLTFESGHVRPLAQSPDGSQLFAVNTPDNRLEVFDVAGGSLTHVHSIPVGMEPVAVAARTNDEVWVVNHVSDTISIVRLSEMNVFRTLLVGDEPTDVRFVPGQNAAFVCVSQEDRIRVYDTTNLDLAPTDIPLDQSDPRSLALSLTNPSQKHTRCQALSFPAILSLQTPIE